MQAMYFVISCLYFVSAFKLVDTQISSEVQYMDVFCICVLIYWYSVKFCISVILTPCVHWNAEMCVVICTMLYVHVQRLLQCFCNELQWSALIWFQMWSRNRHKDHATSQGGWGHFLKPGGGDDHHHGSDGGDRHNVDLIWWWWVSATKVSVCK